VFPLGVEHWMRLGSARILILIKLRIPEVKNMQVRQWGLSFIVKRETAQITN